MKKQLLALLLAAALLLMLFAACAKTETTPNNTDAQSSTGNNETGKNDAGEPAKPADSGNTDVDEPAKPAEPDEIMNVEFWVLDMRFQGETHGERINSLANQITEPQGIHLNTKFMQIGEFEKLRTALASGEVIDALSICIFNGVVNMHANGLLLDITDLLDEYAPETLELMKDYIGAYTYEGRIFGVPTLRGYVSNGYIGFRKDMLEEIGMLETAQKMSSWSEYEQIMAAYYDAHGKDSTFAVSPAAGSLLASSEFHIRGDKFSDIEVTDNLGDSLGVVYTDNDGNVSLLQEEESWVYACKKVKEWFDKGWVYADALYNDPLVADMIAAKTLLSEIFSAEIGVEQAKTATYKAEPVCTQTYTSLIKTGTLNMWGIGVPITAEEPEAAVKLINMLYTNADLMKIFINGEENVDYRLVDGQAEQIEDQYVQANWVFGNNLLAVPFAGTGADYYERIKAQNEAGKCSPFLGFTLETADLSLVMSQISAVTDQYRRYIQCGGFDEKDYEEYLDKLNDAGVRDYLEAVQSQLNAWVATK